MYGIGVDNEKASRSNFQAPSLKDPVQIPGELCESHTLIAFGVEGEESPDPNF